MLALLNVRKKNGQQANADNKSQGYHTLTHFLRTHVGASYKADSHYNSDLRCFRQHGLVLSKIVERQIEHNLRKIGYCEAGDEPEL